MNIETSCDVHGKQSWSVQGDTNRVMELKIYCLQLKNQSVHNFYSGSYPVGHILKILPSNQTDLDNLDDSIMVSYPKLAISLAGSVEHL